MERCVAWCRVPQTVRAVPDQFKFIVSRRNPTLIHQFACHDAPELSATDVFKLDSKVLCGHEVLHAWRGEVWATSRTSGVSRLLASVECYGFAVTSCDVSVDQTQLFVLSTSDVHVFDTACGTEVRRWRRNLPHGNRLRITSGNIVVVIYMKRRVVALFDAYGQKLRTLASYDDVSASLSLKAALCTWQQLVFVLETSIPSIQVFRACDGMFVKAWRVPKQCQIFCHCMAVVRGGSALALVTGYDVILMHVFLPA